MMRRLAEIAQPYKALMRPALFAGVGAVNTAVDVLVFAALTGTGLLAPLYANVLSFSTGAVCSFVLNSLVTFRDRPESRWSAQRMIRFAMVTVLALALSSVVLALALHVLPPLAAKAVSVVVVFAVSYACSTAFVFRAPPKLPPA